MTMVRFGEFYEDKGSGVWKPGKKGISLHMDQWMALKEVLGQVIDAFDRCERTRETVLLTRLPAREERNVNVAYFKGRAYLHIREYYSNQGASAPTQKGCSLNRDNAELLLGSIARIDEALEKMRR
jgi:hypothetical protein